MSGEEIAEKFCKTCDQITPHSKFRPGDKPGFYWRCMFCGGSDIDGDGNSPAKLDPSSPCLSAS